MTELQVTINNLKEVIIVADLVLQKLEKAQKDLEKPKVPSFPETFFVAKDVRGCERFTIGLLHPNIWIELPRGFSGRACYHRKDIRQIITGLQTLLGDQQCQPTNK